MKVAEDTLAWSEVKVIRESETEWRYRIMVPDFLAEWDVYDSWERVRFTSMQSLLKPGDVLFDVGVERGWQSAIYAQFVGGDNMVLFESNPDYWPNIRATWEHNALAIPRASFSGLVGNETSSDLAIRVSDWPLAALDTELIDHQGYRYIHEHAHITQQVKLDDFVRVTGIVPTAITMDIEGAELVALQGAEDVLRTHHPLVWVSLHDELMLKDYGTDMALLHSYLVGLGYYTGAHLGTDHEAHWLFA